MINVTDLTVATQLLVVFRSGWLRQTRLFRWFIGRRRCQAVAASDALVILNVAQSAAAIDADAVWKRELL